MKKSLLLFSLLSGLALLLLPVAVAVAGNGREQVVVTQEVLSGNPSAAAGITVMTASHWDGHLLWDTMYAPGNEKNAKSNFHFSPEKVTWNWEREKHATLAFHAGVDLLDNNNYSTWNAANFVFPKIARDVMYRANKEEYSETVYLRDYYHTYPLVFRIRGISVNYGSYQDSCNHFLQFFHIIPGEEQFKITVTKTSGSKDLLFQGEFVSNAQNIAIADASAFGRNGFYFTYSLENPESGDYAERGENRGIFFFPYKSASENSIEPNWKKVENVGEFPQGLVPVQMQLDEEEKYLYLAARERGEYYLLIYRLDNGVVLQEQIALNYAEDSGSFCRMHFTDNGILLTWEDNYFSFVTVEDGEYRLWCSGVFPETQTDTQEAGNEVSFPGSDASQKGNPFPQENACLFDGKRLVLAAFENWKNLSVLLAVYDEDGQLYSGRYQNSQDMEAKGDAANRILVQDSRMWMSYDANSISPRPIRLKTE